MRKSVFVWKKLNTEIRFRMDILEHTGNIYKLILKSEWGIPAHTIIHTYHTDNSSNKNFSIVENDNKFVLKSVN